MTPLKFANGLTKFEYWPVKEQILAASSCTCQVSFRDGCQFSPCKRALLWAMPACRVARVRAALKTASDAVF